MIDDQYITIANYDILYGKFFLLLRISEVNAFVIIWW